MSPRNRATHHPAYDLLLKLATKGCPVNSSPPWSTTQITDYVAYDNHQSAQDPTAAKAV
jgi:hypothetical protein